MRARSWIRSVMLVAALLMAHAGLASQTVPPPLQVEGVGDPVSVSAAMHRGYAAFPAWVLRSLGARVDPTSRGVRVVLDGDTLEFHSGSPFFTASGRAWQLIEPPYSEGGIVYLPHQLFADWLPGSYPDRIAYHSGRLHLTAAAADAHARTEPARTPAPAQADAQVPVPARTEPAVSVPAGRAAQATTPPAPLGSPLPTHVVVIDPGHGGVDPGRIGPGGLKEKDVVLDVSRRLARILAERGYQVRMTRTTDTLVNLAHRSKMANEWRGNRPGLFLSIHANGVTDQRVRGFETFFLSDARTEDERRVAEMENAAVAYESPNRVVGTDDLDLILNNLRNDYYIRASHDLAGIVQDTFSGFHRGPNRGVKQAGFRVLVGAFMPAVLIELGFISNPTEERLLGSASFQTQMATAIADAVDRFFEKQGDLWSSASP